MVYYHNGMNEFKIKYEVLRPLNTSQNSQSSPKKCSDVTNMALHQVLLPLNNTKELHSVENCSYIIK